MFRFPTLLLLSAITLTISCKSFRESPPKTTKGTVDKTNITIHYGSPSVKDRKIFGELLPYDQVWRTGANEATTIEFSTNVTIEGKSLPAGKYSLFTIPNEDQWTIIFNKVSDQWGAYEYDQKEDALRVQVSANDNSELVEDLTFTVEKGMVILNWEKTTVSFTVAPGN